MKRQWTLFLAGLFSSLLTLQADFEVEVSGVTSGEGFVRALVFVKEAGFPEDRALAVKEVSVPASQAKDGKLILRFAGVRAEEGAVSIFHDRDGSGTMQKNLLGIPREPVALTGWNGKGRPRFAQCQTPLRGLLKLILREL